MKTIKFLTGFFLLLNLSALATPKDSTRIKIKNYHLHQVTFEPAIGLNPWPISDLVISNLSQLNIKKRISVISYTAYSNNSAFLKEFNYIKTNYNFSIGQKFGIGTSIYSKHSSQTLSFLAGIKYNAFKETLENPDFDKVTASVKTVSPDFGLMYNLKKGNKKFFFSYRMFIPLYPYPFKSASINAIDGNLANFSLEFGVGIRLK